MMNAAAMWQPWLDLYAKETQRAAEFAKLVASPPKVGLGETPADVVYTENKLRLLRYRPLTAKQHGTPVVIAYALVNKPTILDLQEDRSVVRRLLEAGHDVYLIDWGTPSDLDRWLGLEDYVDRYYYNCVRKAMEVSGAENVTLLGYCMGGTMGAMFAARHPHLVRNLIIMASPLDFSEADSGLLYQWARPEWFDVDQLVDALGNVPGDFLDGGFSTLKPVENNYQKWVGLYRMAGDQKAVENFLRMEQWGRDGIPVPGETYRQYIKDVYQHNLLAKNEMRIAGKKVDLDELTMPILGLVASKDHLVPMETTKRFIERLPSEDKDVMTLPAGHIGLAVSSKAHKDFWPKVAAWIAERSEPQREVQG